MLRKSLMIGLVAVAAMGLAGTASATCGGYGFGIGHYSMCLLQYDSFSCCGGYSSNFHTIAGVYTGAAGNSVSTGVYQYDFDAFGFTGAGTAVDLYAYTAATGYSGVGVGQYSQQYNGATYAGTGAYASTPAGFVGAQQFSFPGACYLFLFSPLGFQVLPCGPVPVIPTVPQLPHL